MRAVINSGIHIKAPIFTCILDAIQTNSAGPGQFLVSTKPFVFVSTTWRLAETIPLDPPSV